MRASASDVILKAVVLFLAFIAVMAMFGKLHLLGLSRKTGGGKRLSSRKCPSCGRYLVGKGPCPCRAKKG